MTIAPDDFKTVEAVPVPNLTSHNALHDAIYQSIRLSQYLYGLEGIVSAK